MFKKQNKGSASLGVKFKYQVILWVYKAISQLLQCFLVIIQGQTPLHEAASNGKDTCCSILLFAGSNVDCTDNTVMV